MAKIAEKMSIDSYKQEFSIPHNCNIPEKWYNKNRKLTLAFGYSLNLLALAFYI